MKILALLILLFPALAHAEEVCAQQAQAQVLFDEGAELFKARDYAAAAAKLEASVNTCPRFVGARGRLAECYEQLGRLASAWAAWRDVAGVAEKTGNDKDRQRAVVARQRAAGLEPRLARLVVVVGDEVQVDGLVVSRDGRPLAAAAHGLAVPIDAGRHRVLASAPGHVPWRLDVDVVDGDRVSVTIEPLDRLPVVAPERVTEIQRVPDAGAARQRRRDRLITAGALGGAGVLLLGGAGYFALDSRATWNDAREQHGCGDDGTCPTSAGVSLVEDARRAGRSADVLAGVGAAAIVAGAIVWLTAPDEPREPRFGLTPLPGGAAVSGRIRF